jgi:hypothetical protein
MVISDDRNYRKMEVKLDLKRKKGDIIWLQNKKVMIRIKIKIDKMEKSL